LQPARPISTASRGDADVITLLTEYVAAKHGDPAAVGGLKALWLAATDDIQADLTAGALKRLVDVLERPFAGTQLAQAESAMAEATAMDVKVSAGPIEAS
jgi:hypothetical protein